ncbi:hypothetical protein C8F04DRAFT_1261143 [Mycena alexandri]|uniref:Uncharacterized protein n=1 Tax=Mycena alexandri TaxID=1745969 RepID=A0AAD6STV4_9AGAR|nr:hypothetical protein C8F04DRAFT_1261143 [Mycena alexandri]
MTKERSSIPLRIKRLPSAPSLETPQSLRVFLRRSTRRDEQFLNMMRCCPAQDNAIMFAAHIQILMSLARGAAPAPATARPKPRTRVSTNTANRRDYDDAAYPPPAPGACR